MGVSVLSGTAKGGADRSTESAIRIPQKRLLFRLLSDCGDWL